MDRIWSPYLSELDMAVLAATGSGQRVGFGKRPALLIVDVNYAGCGDRREPILESIKRWPDSCGTSAWDALDVIDRLLKSARSKGVPVIYSTGFRRPDEWDDQSWSWKTAQASTPLDREVNSVPMRDEIMEQIAPRLQDIVVLKQRPSAFAGTNLLPYLIQLGADSVIVVGTTTSGCVRATVVDAFSCNFRVTVVEDGCFDRTTVSHAINLFDMDMKYGDVLPSSSVIEYLDRLAANQFELPPGVPTISSVGR
jgi:nicotinamidase-related amidase